MQFITLWRSLTVMQPQEKAQYDEDHQAIFRMDYVAHPTTGDVVAELHVTSQLAIMMKLKTNPNTDGQQFFLWQQCWEEQITGRDAEMGEAHKAANESLQREGVFEVGKHRTQQFTKNSYFPFKIKLIVYPEEEQVTYDVEEYEKRWRRSQVLNKVRKRMMGIIVYHHSHSGIKDLHLKIQTQSPKITSGNPFQKGWGQIRLPALTQIQLLALHTVSLPPYQHSKLQWQMDAKSGRRKKKRGKNCDALNRRKRKLFLQYHVLCQHSKNFYKQHRRQHRQQMPKVSLRGLRLQ